MELDPQAKIEIINWTDAQIKVNSPMISYMETYEYIRLWQKKWFPNLPHVELTLSQNPNIVSYYWTYYFCITENIFEQYKKHIFSGQSKTFMSFWKDFLFNNKDVIVIVYVSADSVNGVIVKT